MKLFEIPRRQKQPAAKDTTEVELAAQSVFDDPKLRAFYDPVMLGPGTLGAFGASSACIRQSLEFLQRLDPDDYVRYLIAYYKLGLARYGEYWRYADIVTVLLAAARMVQPSSYLEIGVRRGRSMAMIASMSPKCHIVGFDMWMPNYADMENPGPELVKAQLAKLGYTKEVNFINGNSHETVPKYLAENPNAFFDIITVDGDHSAEGAEQDLRDVMPRLKLGGVMVFDDICSPVHPYLGKVWQKVVANDPRFETWEFAELGYGIALAVRKKA